jgi:hypothetical protein
MTNPSRTWVRTRAETCECPDPWHAHDAFIFDRGDGVRHHVQDIISKGAIDLLKPSA